MPGTALSVKYVTPGIRVGYRATVGKSHCCDCSWAVVFAFNEHVVIVRTHKDATTAACT
jgi:hypothetical protein